MVNTISKASAWQEERQRVSRRLLGLCLLACMLLWGCSGNQQEQVSQEEYLNQFAVPVLLQLSEELVNMGSFADSLQAFCTGSEEVRQNYDYVLFAAHLNQVGDTIKEYPKEQVPDSNKKMHTALLNLADCLDDFLAQYPEVLMAEDDAQLEQLFQPLYEQLNYALNYLPDQLGLLAEGEVES